MKKSAVVFVILLSIILVRCEKEKSGLISKNQEISFGEQLDSLVINSVIFISIQASWHILITKPSWQGLWLMK